MEKVMKHYVKELAQWGYNIKEINKRINILDLASYFVEIHEKDNVYYAGILDWDNLTNGKNVIYFNKEENSFSYNKIKGGPEELFTFLTPKTDFFAFIKKVYNISRFEYLDYVIFENGERRVFHKYPINLNEIFYDKENL